MTFSDFDLGWALRRIEEAELALAEARASPDSVKRYLVIKAILAGRQSLLQFLGPQDSDRRIMGRTDESLPEEKVDLIRVLDEIVNYLQRSDVDEGTVLSLGDLTISTIKNTILNIRQIYSGQGS